MTNSTNTGKVKFFNESKGYGFITDDESGTEYFFHFTGMVNQVRGGDKVSFELEKGRKGPKAINITKLA